MKKMPEKKTEENYVDPGTFQIPKTKAPFIDFESETLAIDVLKYRKALQKDSIVIFVGDKRAGKSWASIKLAEQLDRNFDVATNLFFDAQPFFEAFKDAHDQVFILDEVSVSFSDARMWYEVSNRIFNQLIMTQGFRRNVLLFTLPNLLDLDKRAIRLSTYIWEAVKINFETKMCLLRCSRIKTFHSIGKSWIQSFQWINMGLPSENNLVKYEKMKKEWNDKKMDENIAYMEIINNPSQFKKGFNENFYIDAFTAGSMPENEFRSKMLELNHSQEDVDLAVDYVSKMQENAAAGKDVREQKKLAQIEKMKSQTALNEARAQRIKTKLQE